MRPNRFILKLTSFPLFQQKHTWDRERNLFFFCLHFIGFASKKPSRISNEEKFPWHDLAIAFLKYFRFICALARRFMVRSLNEFRAAEYTWWPLHCVHPHALCFNKSAQTHTIFDERSLCRLRCRRCRYFGGCSVSLSTHIFTFAQSQNFIFMFAFFCVVAVSQRTKRAPRHHCIIYLRYTEKSVCCRRRRRRRHRRLHRRRWCIFQFQSKYTGFSVNYKCPSNQFETINTNNNGISVYFQLQKYIRLWLRRTRNSHVVFFSFLFFFSLLLSFALSSFGECFFFAAIRVLLFSSSAFHVDFINSAKSEQKIVHGKNIHVIHESSSQTELQTNQ